MDRRRLFAVLLLFVGFALPSTASTLVYSARYYNPPGSRRQTSHSHLYEMHVGAHGHLRPRQLTFGRHDDASPKYSPDRRWILFLRDNNHAVCVMRANGGVVRTLDTTDDMMEAGFWAATWWPTGDLVFIPATSEKPAKLVRVSDGKTVRRLGVIQQILVSPSGEFAYCLTGKGDVISRIDGLTLVTVRKNKSDHADWLTSTSLVTYSLSRYPTNVDDMTLIKVDGTKSFNRPIPVAQVVTDAAEPRLLQAIPGVSSSFLVGFQSTHRENDLYRIDARTGKATPWLMHKAFVTFDGIGDRYVTAGDDIIPYGSDRQVWGGDLLLGFGLADLHPKPLVSGLVDIDGADWR